MSIGIPFMFDIEFKRDAKGLHGVGKCPACGEAIVLRKKKDRESFSKVEYAAHYEKAHSAPVNA
jgi:hypothetical protein